MSPWKLIEKFKDGTVRYFNPFAGSEAWYTPERRHRPLHTNISKNSSPIDLHHPQDYCAFCPAHYRQTTPEKTRIVIGNDEWQMQNRLAPAEVFEQTTPLRRIGNLYEIFAYDYWRQNYDHTLSKDEQEHQKIYLDDANGREHVLRLLAEKYNGNGRLSASSINSTKLQQMSAFLFGGSHELVVPSRHFVDGAMDPRNCAAQDR